MCKQFKNDNSHQCAVIATRKDNIEYKRTFIHKHSHVNNEIMEIRELTKKPVTEPRLPYRQKHKRPLLYSSLTRCSQMLVRRIPTVGLAMVEYGLAFKTTGWGKIVSNAGQLASWILLNKLSSRSNGGKFLKQKKIKPLKKETELFFRMVLKFNPQPSFKILIFFLVA